MTDLTDHAKGLLVTTAGVLALSPDSLLVRLIGIDQWTMVFWRGALLALSLNLFLYVTRRGSLVEQFRGVGRQGLWISVTFTISSILFITALSHTSVANTLIIISASPLFGAFFSGLFLVEPVAPRTWSAILGALVGIAIIVWGSLGQGHLPGDLAALGAAISIAAMLAIIRQRRARNIIPAMALAGATSALVSLPLAAPLALHAAQAGLMAVLGLLVLPIAIVLTTLGPRYLPAPEVGLIMLLETVLGPLWVWLVISEEPGARSLLGGAIVVGSLVIHSLLGLRRVRAPVIQG